MNKHQRLKLLLDEPSGERVVKSRSVLRDLEIWSTESTPTCSRSYEDTYDSNNFLPPTRVEETMKLSVGQSANRTEEFCPILALSTLPKYVPKNVSDLLNESFFKERVFWRNTWTIFYVWPPGGSFHKRPLLLTPLYEAKRFIDYMNMHFSQTSNADGTHSSQETINAEILQAEGLVLSFDYSYSGLRPRFLGYSDTREGFTSLERIVPKSSWRPETEQARESQPPQVCLEEFRMKVEKQLDMQAAPKQPRKIRAAHAKQKQAKASTDLRKLERLFGLRPRTVEITMADTDLDDPWKAYQEVEAERIRNLFIPAPNLHEVASYPFESEVVFVCIDAESYEKAPRMITEVGISTLDTRDLRGKAPGIRGQNWFRFIRSHHFRIKENAHLINETFVRGCPGDFRYGSSKMIRLADAPAIVACCFKPPFFAPTTCFTDVNDCSRNDDNTRVGGKGKETTASAHEPRRVVLVGHDIRQDIRYLHLLGYNVYNLSSLKGDDDIIDTQLIFRALNAANSAEDPQPASLGRVLRSMNIEAVGLHNAGNDAALTLRALLAMVLKHASERDCNEDELAHRLDSLLGTKTAQGPPRERAPGESVDGMW